MNFKKIAILSVSVFSIGAMADTPTFNNLSSDDFSKIMKDFSAVSSYTSVSGASGRGNIFGFEVGVVGDVTNTPNVNTVVHNVSSSTDVSKIPSASVLAGVSLPMGLSLEAMFLPSTTVSGLTYQQTGFAAQYRVVDFLLSLSAKAHYSSTKFSYSQSLNNSTTGNVPVNVTVNFDNSQWGLDLLLGKDLIFFEPYIGLGYESSNANLGVTGSTTASLFATSFTSAQSANSTPSTVRFFAGVEFKLLIMKIAAEYMRAYDTDRYEAKLSFGF